MMLHVRSILRGMFIHILPPPEGAKLWKNISLGGIALCVVVGAYEYKVHLDHHNGPQYEDEKNLFPYRKIRAKPFPWTCSDCGLFETEWCTFFLVVHFFSPRTLFPFLAASRGSSISHFFF
jgi:hypothetical protein